MCHQHDSLVSSINTVLHGWPKYHSSSHYRVHEYSKVIRRIVLLPSRCKDTNEGNEHSKYVHINGNAVATIRCLDQDQDDDDRNETGPHNFPWPPLLATLLVLSSDGGIVLARVRWTNLRLASHINDAHVNRPCRRRRRRRRRVRLALTLWRLTRGLCAFRVYRFFD